MNEFDYKPDLKNIFGFMLNAKGLFGAILGGLALGAGATGASKLLGGGGGGDVKMKTVPETEEAKKARARLLELAEGEPPDVPLQKIAPLQPMTEERKLARTTAKELAEPQDFLSLREVQAIIEEAKTQGNLLANRVGRWLQTAGNITASSGRDVLGRTVKGIEKSLAAALAPFGMAERARRTSMIPMLEGLGLTEETLKRGLTQDQLDAYFRQEYEESKQLETFTIPLLQSIIGTQPAVQPIVQGQGTNALTQMAPLIGPLLASAMTGGAGTSGYSYLPGQGSNLYKTTTWGGGL